MFSLGLASSSNLGYQTSHSRFKLPYITQATGKIVSSYLAVMIRGEEKFMFLFVS